MKNNTYKTLYEMELLNRYLEKQQREINQEPNLSEIQQLLATLPFNETDEQLLDQYFKQRAKEEGIIWYQHNMVILSTLCHTERSEGSQNTNNNAEPC